MLFSRALLGCCLGGYWTIVLSSSGHLVKPQDSARAIAIVLSGITLATVVGVPLGTYVGSLGTWRAAFLCTAVIVAIALIGQSFALPSLYARNRIGWSSLSALLRRSAARRTLATVALVIAAHLAAYTYVTPYLIDDAKLSSKTVPGILLAFGLVGLVANFGIARWAAKAPGLSTIWVVGLFAACFLMLPLVAHSLLATSAFLVVWAACNGCIILCLTLWIGENTADHQEAGSAMFVSTVQIAIALGSVLGGFAVDGFGVPANFILGCLFALGAGAFAFSHHTRTA
jgi:predicted MFS family arabinose efflux permease